MATEPLRTPEEARQWLAEHGISGSRFAQSIGVPRHVVYDLLNGRTAGRWGDAHRAAVALGMKRAPKGPPPLVTRTAAAQPTPTE